MRLTAVIVGMTVLVLWSGVGLAQTDTPTSTPTRTPTITPTWTPASCGGASAEPVVQVMQLHDRSCLPVVHGPTTGRCVVGVTHGVVILDCPGQTRKKFDVSDWP